MMSTISNAPRAFAVAEPRLFRSSAFSKEHFPFVKLLRLRTILYLSSEEPPHAISDFCNEEEVTFLNPAASQRYNAGDWSPLRGDLARISLQILLDATRLPLMIICLSGVQQTGALVGCLRKLQGWSLTSIVEEHRRFCEVSSWSLIEHFIEMFDVDVVTFPKTLPEWFLDDLAMLREEEVEERKRISSASMTINKS